MVILDGFKFVETIRFLTLDDKLIYSLSIILTHLCDQFIDNNFFIP